MSKEEACRRGIEGNYPLTKEKPEFRYKKDEDSVYYESSSLRDFALVQVCHNDQQAKNMEEMANILDNTFLALQLQQAANCGTNLNYLVWELPSYTFERDAIGRFESSRIWLQSHTRGLDPDETWQHIFYTKDDIMDMFRIAFLLSTRFQIQHNRLGGESFVFVKELDKETRHVVWHFEEAHFIKATDKFTKEEMRYYNAFQLWTSLVKHPKPLPILIEGEDNDPEQDILQYMSIAYYPFPAGHPYHIPQAIMNKFFKAEKFPKEWRRHATKFHEDNIKIMEPFGIGAHMTNYDVEEAFYRCPEVSSQFKLESFTPLGKGANGLVYSVCDVSEKGGKKKKCNKVIKVVIGVTKRGGQKEVENEANFLLMLNDSGLTPKIYGFYYCEDTFYLVLQKESNQDVADTARKRFKEHPKMNREVFDDELYLKWEVVFMFYIADFLTKKGIYHGDLKPEQYLYAEEEEEEKGKQRGFVRKLKITDFDFSGLFNGNPQAYKGFSSIEDGCGGDYKLPPRDDTATRFIYEHYYNFYQLWSSLVLYSNKPVAVLDEDDGKIYYLSGYVYPFAKGHPYHVPEEAINIFISDENPANFDPKYLEEHPFCADKKLKGRAQPIEGYAPLLIQPPSKTDTTITMDTKHTEKQKTPPPQRQSSPKKEEEPAKRKSSNKKQPAPVEEPAKRKSSNKKQEKQQKKEKAAKEKKEKVKKEKKDKVKKEKKEKKKGKRKEKERACNVVYVPEGGFDIVSIKKPYELRREDNHNKFYKTGRPIPMRSVPRRTRLDMLKTYRLCYGV